MSRWTIYFLCDQRDGEPVYVGCTLQPVETRLSQHLNDKACRNRQMHLWFEMTRLAGSHVELHTLFVAEDERTARALEASTIKRWSEKGSDLFNKVHGRKLRERATLGHLQLWSAFGHDYPAFNSARLVRDPRQVWQGLCPDTSGAIRLHDALRIPFGAWLTYLGPRQSDEACAA